MTATRQREDLYPSRVDDRARLLPRRDPVVWPDPEAAEGPGPLPPGQVERFDRDGFLVFPHFFNAGETAACLDELDRLCADREVKRRREAILEPDDHGLRSLFWAHRISPLFGRVAADARIVGMMRQLLGGDVYLHQSRVNLKPGFAGQEFYWHSDFETWHVEDGMPRMRAVSCSLLLTENFTSNGPLMVVPGSHRSYVACAGRTPEDHYKKSLRRQEYGVPDPAMLTKLVRDGGIAEVVGGPGALVLFECNLMHGSNGNITPYPRSNLFLCYNSVRNRLEEPFCGLKPRPEFIASREHAEAVAPGPPFNGGMA